jgi:PAS domain S-box-containing protein
MSSRLTGNLSPVEEKILFLKLAGLPSDQIIENVSLENDCFEDVWERICRETGARHLEEFKFWLADNVLKSIPAPSPETHRTYGGGRWTLDARSKTARWSKGASNALKFLNEVEVREMSDLQPFIHPSDWPDLQLSLDRLMVENGVLDVTCRLAAPHELSRVRLQASAEYSSSGELVRYLGDIDELPDLTDLARGREGDPSLFESITETMSETVYIFDLTNQSQIYANRNLSKLLGFSVEELSARGSEVVTSLVHLEDLGSIAEHQERIANLTDGEFSEVEYRLQTSVGKWITVVSRDVVFKRDLNGVPIEVLGILREVTARRRLNRPSFAAS